MKIMWPFPRFSRFLRWSSIWSKQKNEPRFPSFWKAVNPETFIKSRRCSVLGPGRSTPIWPTSALESSLLPGCSTKIPTRPLPIMTARFWPVWSKPRRKWASQPFSLINRRVFLKRLVSVRKSQINILWEQDRRSAASRLKTLKEMWLIAMIAPLIPWAFPWTPRWIRRDFTP